MKVKTVILWLLLAGVSYAFYGYAKVHFSQPAIVYKRYVSGLIENEPERVADNMTGTQPRDAFYANAQRLASLRGEPRLIWYEFNRREDSADGNTVRFITVCHIRVDPPGQKTYWGTEDRPQRHEVTLVKQQSSWKVARFNDATTLAVTASLPTTGR